MLQLQFGAKNNLFLHSLFQNPRSGKGDARGDALFRAVAKIINQPVLERMELTTSDELVLQGQRIAAGQPEKDTFKITLLDKGQPQLEVMVTDEMLEPYDPKTFDVRTLNDALAGVVVKLANALLRGDAAKNLPSIF